MGQWQLQQQTLWTRGFAASRHIIRKVSALRHCSCGVSRSLTCTFTCSGHGVDLSPMARCSKYRGNNNASLFRLRFHPSARPWPSTFPECILFHTAALYLPSSAAATPDPTVSLLLQQPMPTFVLGYRPNPANPLSEVNHVRYQVTRVGQRLLSGYHLCPWAMAPHDRVTSSSIDASPTGYPDNSETLQR